MFTRRYEIWLLIIFVSFREELVIVKDRKSKPQVKGEYYVGIPPSRGGGISKDLRKSRKK